MSRSLLPRTIPVLPVLANLVRVRARDAATPQRIAQVQTRLLRELVQHAYTNVPYYRDGGVHSVGSAAALSHVPVLERDELRAMKAANVHVLFADGFGPANTRAASTSGSSGMPVTLYYSERDLGYLRAAFLWDLLASGLRPTDRIGFFRVGAFRRHRLERLGLARNVHVNTSLSLDEQVETFLARRPTFLIGFPSALTALVVELRRRAIRPQWVRGVVFGGESVTAAARAEVLGYLGATGHEVYASVEAHTIARTCPLGAMHLRSADVVVEVMHDDGTISAADTAERDLTGDILVTRLHAEAMPLLRYRLGDRVHIAPNDCPCDVRFTPILREVTGRVQDRIRTRDGRLRSADFIFSLVAGVPGVLQQQLVHHGDGRAELLVVPDRNGPADIADQLRTALLAAAPDFDVAVRLVASIPTEANGKIRGVRLLRETADS